MASDRRHCLQGYQSGRTFPWFSKRCSISDRLATFALTAIAFPPFLGISDTVFCAPTSSEEKLTVTFAAAKANPLAMPARLERDGVIERRAITTTLINDLRPENISSASYIDPARARLLKRQNSICSLNARLPKWKRSPACARGFRCQTASRPTPQ
jgi:hypothetical protein